MSVLLVTGGSRGIGADIARLASERGWHVGVNYVSDEASARAVVKEIKNNGREGIAVRADVANPADVAALFETVEASLGPITALVNSAGLATGMGKIETLDFARTRRMFEVNVLGLYLCCQHAVLRMARCHGGNGGAIVNISSAAARSGSPGTFVDYAAAKAAVDTLTIGLAKEQGPEGIRVNGLRPGVINTDMVAEVAAKDPTWLGRILANTPLGRIGEMRDVSTAVLWLLSDEARHTTGTIMDISGGLCTQ
jgi:NAD(P)-dependent dehydrogenase (short-subunit alcohol dehydrogenase family)